MNESAPSLSPDHLRSFEAFARHLSFTSAARELHLSQPAVHKHVQRLTEQLAVPLYTREGRVIALTDAGREAQVFATERAERERRFADRLRGVERERPVRLACGEGALLYLLGATLGELHARGVRVNPTVQAAEGAIEALRAARVDVGVAALPSIPEGLEGQPIATAGAVVVVPKAHRLAGRRAIWTRDLSGERLVVPPSSRPLRQALSARADFEVAMEVHGWPLMLRMAELGLGATVVNDFCPTPRGMVAVPVRDLSPVTYWALRAPRRLAPRSAAVVYAALAGPR